MPGTMQDPSAGLLCDDRVDAARHTRTCRTAARAAIGPFLVRRYMHGKLSPPPFLKRRSAPFETTKATEAILQLPRAVLAPGSTSKPVLPGLGETCFCQV